MFSICGCPRFAFGRTGRSVGAGISLTDANALVEKNAVTGGNAEFSYGIIISGASTVIIRNNTVHGGNSYNTYGVNIGVGTTVTLQNNTIYSGPSIFEVALNLGAPAIIENNIMFTSTCVYCGCVNETNADADPIRMFANDLYGCDQRFFLL